MNNGSQMSAKTSCNKFLQLPSPPQNPKIKMIFPPQNSRIPDRFSNGFVM